MFIAVMRDTDARMQKIVNDTPPCPNCDEPHVQITDWFATPMKWRCRLCLHPFAYEPQAPSDPSTFWERIMGWLH